MSEWLLDFDCKNNEWKIEAVNRATLESYKLNLREGSYALCESDGAEDDFFYVTRDACRPGLLCYPRFKWVASKAGFYSLNFTYSLINEENMGGAVIRIYKGKSLNIEGRVIYSEVSEFSSLQFFEENEVIAIEIDYVTHLNSGDVLFYMEVNEVIEKKEPFISFKTIIPEGWVHMSEMLGIANLKNGIDPAFTNYIKETSINEAAINSTPDPLLWNEVQSVISERSILGSSRLFNAEKVVVK
jgi:hypothetical protein